MTMKIIEHDVDALRQALADTLEDPRLSLYWRNALTGNKSRIVNVRYNNTPSFGSSLQVKQGSDWYAVVDTADTFTLE